MKKEKLVLVIFILLFVFSNELYSQNVNDSTSVPVLKTPTTRTMFFALSVGYPEYSNLKLGYKLNKEWSVCLKVASYYDGKGGGMYFGTRIWGIKISRYFEPIILNMNNISFDAGYDKNGSYNNYAFDLSIGNESISNTLIKPYWAFSLTAIKAYDYSIFISPGVKVGVNFNF